jgi:hypothetical protein
MAVSLARYADQVFNKLTSTTIAFEGTNAAFDVPSAMIPDDHREKIVIQRDGTYQVAGQIVFAANAGGGSVQSRLMLSGAEIKRDTFPAHNAPQSIGSNSVYLLSAGDEITLEGYYDGSGNLSPAVLGDTSFGAHGCALMVAEVPSW